VTNSEIRAFLAALDPAALRSRAQISLRTVERALGINWKTIWQWERGIRTPTGPKGAAYARFIAGLARHEAVTWDVRGRVR
jgi:DNA-binding transcriptional regulator YiaG